MATDKLPTEEPPRTTAIDNWGMDKLNVEYRREADRERDGWYMSRDEFKQWWQDVVMGAKQ